MLVMNAADTRCLWAAARIRAPGSTGSETAFAAGGVRESQSGGAGSAAMSIMGALPGAALSPIAAEHTANMLKPRTKHFMRQVSDMFRLWKRVR
jgi:hypothetical protein